MILSQLAFMGRNFRDKVSQAITGPPLDTSPWNTDSTIKDTSIILAKPSLTVSYNIGTWFYFLTTNTTGLTSAFKMSMNANAGTGLTSIDVTLFGENGVTLEEAKGLDPGWWLTKTFTSKTSDVKAVGLRVNKKSSADVKFSWAY